MSYDFDRVIERRGTLSLKYDMTGRGKPADLLPLWVADMDFPAPPCVLDALQAQLDHGVFGYTEAGEGYFEALYGWFSRRFGWRPEPDWLVKTPGVVAAMFIAVRALTEPGDGVLIQQPVYYPFGEAVRAAGRRLAVNSLLEDDGRYAVDFSDFEEQIVQHGIKLFILCSPHNPVGRVWTKAELTRMGEICLKHGVTIVSDEIHQDFVYEGHSHHVFAGLSAELRDITVTCTAPTKTFNLAGLQISNIFIANEGLRRRFREEYARGGLSQLGVFGLAGCQAAYQGGEQWLEALLAYLAGNMALISQAAGRMPGVAFTPPEGTYLAWLDFRALGLTRAGLDNLLTNQARLWLSDGQVFGAGGAGFARLNAACPRSLLAEALERLERAVTKNFSA